MKKTHKMPKSESLEQLGKEVKERRTKANLSLREVARLGGVSYESVRLVETGNAGSRAILAVMRVLDFPAKQQKELVFAKALALS